MEIKKEAGKKQEEKISILLEDLASLESYTKDLFSFLPLPICFVSSIGVILELNPAFERLSGYKVEEVIGETTEKIFNSKQAESLSQEIFQKGFVKDKEIFLYTKEKETIPISVSATIKKTKENENIGYFLGFFDLTEIKKKEKDLQKELQKVEKTGKALINILEDVDEERNKAEEEKNKTLTIIKNLSDGILFFNKKNRVLLINPEAEKIFSLKEKEIINKSFLELADFSNLKGLISLVKSRAKKVYRKELILKENLILEVSVLPILAGKEKIGVLVILHDITREKMIEKIKTEFVSVAAHQLRTPLSAIKWTLRMLLDGDLGEITKEQRSFIEKTYNSNERMVALINDLLNVSRIEEGKYLYKQTLADLEKIVALVINSFQDQIARKKITLNFKKSETKLPNVNVDVEKIKLVVHNFIDNAIKYMFPNGEISISIAYKEKEKQVIFSIKDTGVGIPFDQQPRLFSKFFRGANAIRMDTEGSGLGLFITKNIIEAHGGKIWFESEENKGTVFYFSLPIKEEFSEFLKGF